MKNSFRKVSMVVSMALVLSLSFGLNASVYADDKMESKQLVDKARMTLEVFMKAPEMEAFRSLIKNARGVLIVPQILKGAFVIGGSYGTGVLLARETEAGHFAGPAFYTIGEVSWGFQAGGEASEVILLAMTERGVTALLGSSAKLGANAGVAAGPVGMGAAASTANLSADILSFAHSAGLYGGIALDGAVVKVRDGLNDAYYGRKTVTPSEILVKKTVTNPYSHSLLETVSKAAGKK